MLIKPIQIVMDSSGNQIDLNYRPIRSHTNYRHIIQIVAPNLASEACDVTVSTYGSEILSETTRTRLAVDSNGTYLKGAAVVNEEEDYYSAVSNYNVWEVELIGPVASILQKINSSKIAIVISFSTPVVDARALVNLGSFGSAGDLPTISTETEGDYYVCDSLAYTSTIISTEFKYNDIAFYDGSTWVKGKVFRMIQTCPIIQLSVDPSLALIYDEPTDEMAQVLIDDVARVDGIVSDVQTKVNTVVADNLNLNNDITVLEDATALNTAKITFDTVSSTKLDGIEEGAEVNVELASEAEAQAGLEATKTMTPFTTKQAILEQISATGDVVTTLSLTLNTLTYTDEDGVDTNIDLSLYLDDTNLAQIVSGVYDSDTNTLIFTRSDATLFSVDASMFFDDTNLVTSINGKVGIVVLGTDDIAEGETNKYYTEDRVAANSAVVLNTAKVSFDSTSSDKLAAIEEGAEVNVADVLTTLSLSLNTLTYTDENAATTDIDLSLYLDDTNLARITSGVYNSELQTLVFTRDDETTFSIDASMFFDDTNLVTSINGEVGIVVLDTDDIAEGATNKYADSNATNQGNTFNGISQLVQTDASGRLPEIDGSQLTNLPEASAAVSSVNTKTGAVVLDADDIDEGTTNKYYTEAKVAANSAVVLNTAKISFDSTSSTKLGTIEEGAEVNDPETVTTLSLVTNTLTYVDENGTSNTIDLSLYLDDTNLAQIISGVYNSELQTLVFTRSDDSTFSVDASMFLDDTNLVTSINGEVGIVVLDTDDVDEGATNKYYTEAKVAANSAVVLNTAKISFDSTSSTKLSGIEEGAEVNVAPTEYTATIAIDTWTGSVAPFTKAITVSGIVATDRPIIDLDLSSATYANVADIEADWANIYRGVTSTDTITFYTSEVPTIAIPITIKVVN